MRDSHGAQSALLEAMARYGFKDADRGHTDSSCWCGPALHCSSCGQGSCFCGAPVSVVHRSSS